MLSIQDSCSIRRERLRDETLDSKKEKCRRKERKIIRQTETKVKNKSELMEKRRKHPKRKRKKKKVLKEMVVVDAHESKMTSLTAEGLSKIRFCREPQASIS